jgi:hypothetical protein
LYFVGLDLGQASDPSALCALQRSDMPADHTGTFTRMYDVLGLKRWPLGTAYPVIVREVADLLKERPLKGCQLIIDATGVGRPVRDLFREAKLPAELLSVIITPGHAQTFTEGFHHVAKVILISGVQILLQQRFLRFAADLPDIPVLVREFANYRVKVTPAANEVFNAREGEHDDVVLAVALACWAARRPGAGDFSFAPQVLPIGGGIHGALARAEPASPLWSPVLSLAQIIRGA